MNYKKVYRYSIFILLALAVGCSSSTATQTFLTATTIPTPTPALPSFVNHPRPEVSLSFKAFENAGCPLDRSGVCATDSPLYALGCDEIEEPSDLLGALEPAYPIVLCVTDLETRHEEIGKLGEAHQNKCATSPDDVCLSIDEIIEEACDQIHGNVCDSYYEAMEEKCAGSPESICDDEKGIRATESQVANGLWDAEHIGHATYSYNPKGAYFFRDGGLYPAVFQYVIFQDDHFVLIETEAEFREIFAPLETKEQALGYVKAVTGLGDYYGLAPYSGHEYFVDVIQDTHADAVTDGYLVHLYIKPVYGCGPHTVYAVDFHVTPAGYVEQVGMMAVFKDTSADGLCAD